MNQERIYKVILAPHISEKSTIVADANRQFVFKVAKDATKFEIKKAVEALFDVKVDSVTTMNVKGKTKRFGYRFGKRPDWKKACVSLKEGFDIDFQSVE